MIVKPPISINNARLCGDGTIESKFSNDQEIDSMIRLTKIVLTMICLLSFAQPCISQSLQVVESTFCIELDGPACIRPVVSDSTEISLSNLYQGKIYFWSSIQTNENRNIMHVWSASNRTDKWAEPVHVSWSDQVWNLTNDIIRVAENFLRIIYDRGETQLHSVQGIFLSVKKSPHFRTYSSIQAAPGTYSVEVRNMNNQVVQGGEPKTITIIH